MRRVAQSLEPVHLEAHERVDRAELVGDEDLPAGTRDASELRDGERGHANVVENAMAAGEVELRVAERKLHDVALEEPHVGRCVRPARVEVVHTRVDADDLRDAGRQGEGDGSCPAPGVERDLGAGERPEEAPESVGELGSALLLQGKPKVDAHISSLDPSRGWRRPLERPGLNLRPP
ncbi:MAG TPA: hypothetical protein VFT94_01605 [Gaiellaceae bacterium]|nr:hypothetical protein [Gaiellaceae bacterium]